MDHNELAKRMGVHLSSGSHGEREHTHKDRRHLKIGGAATSDKPSDSARLKRPAMKNAPQDPRRKPLGERRVGTLSPEMEAWHKARVEKAKTVSAPKAPEKNSMATSRIEKFNGGPVQQKSGRERMEKAKDELTDTIKRGMRESAKRQGPRKDYSAENKKVFEKGGAQHMGNRSRENKEDRKMALDGGRMKADAEEAGRRLKSGAEKFGAGVKDGAEKLGSKIKGGAEEGFRRVKDSAEDTGRKIKGGFEDFGNKFRQAFHFEEGGKVPRPARPIKRGEMGAPTPAKKIAKSPKNSGM